jgi:UDP-glucuronate 4-epimerase
MTTLVTGAFGCIGAWVVRGLLARGERPVAFDLGDDPWRMRMIVGPDVGGRLTVVRGDIADREHVTRAVLDHGVDRIIHLAAWQVPLCRQDPPAPSSTSSAPPTSSRPPARRRDESRTWCTSPRPRCSVRPNSTRPAR